MIIYFRDIFDEEFVSKFIPGIVKERALLLSKRANTILMDEYLQSNYKISIENIINQLRFNINHFGNIYSISVNNNIKESKSQERLSSLVKLIDSGNREIGGLHIVDSSMSYIKSHLKAIYNYYQMKGGM